MKYQVSFHLLNDIEAIDIQILSNYRSIKDIYIAILKHILYLCHISIKIGNTLNIIKWRKKVAIELRADNQNVANCKIHGLIEKGVCK